MQAAVARKAVVRPVLDAVGIGVGGSHVDASVRKDHPHRPGIPGVAAEELFHPGGIVGRQRFIVRVGAQGEDVDLPGDPGFKVVYGGIGIFPAHRLHRRIPVGILHPAGRGLLGRRGGHLLGGRRRGFRLGFGFLLRGHRAGALQLLQGLRPRHAVRRQPVGPLERHQGFIGLRPEFAVRLARQVSQADQLLLQLLHLAAAGALPQVSVRRGGGRRRGRLLVGSVLRRRGRLGRSGRRRHRVDGIHQAQGRAARGPVVVHAVVLLEGPDRPLRGAAVVSVRLARQVSQVDQRLLHHGHFRAHGAPAQGFIAGFRGNPALLVSGGRGRLGHRGRRRALGQHVFAEEQVIGALARHAVRLQAVVLLEGLQGLHALVAELAVHPSLVVSQLLQPPLDGFRVLPFRVPLHRHDRHRIGRGRGGRRGGGGGRGGIGFQGAVRFQRLPGRGAGHAVRRQAVLLLEGLHGLLGRGVIFPGNRAVVVSQRLQPALQLAHGVPGGVLLHGGALDRAQGPHLRGGAGGVLRLPGVQEGLDVRVHDPGGGIVVGLLEEQHRVLRRRAELPVRRAPQEAQLQQRLLQRLHVLALAALLQNLVFRRALLGAQRRRRGGGRGRPDLFDFLQHDVFILHIAGGAVVFHLGPGAAVGQHGDVRSLGNLLQQRAADGFPLPQVHLFPGDGAVGIGAHRLHGLGGHRRDGVLLRVDILRRHVARLPVVSDPEEAARLLQHLHLRPGRHGVHHHRRFGRAFAKAHGIRRRTQEGIAQRRQGQPPCQGQQSGHHQPEPDPLFPHGHISYLHPADSFPYSGPPGLPCGPARAPGSLRAPSFSVPRKKSCQQRDTRLHFMHSYIICQQDFHLFVIFISFF